MTAWQTAQIQCMPLHTPREYDYSIYNMRVRFTQDDEYDIAYYAKKHVGGPGMFWIKTNRGGIQEYAIENWLKPENFSWAMLMRELNEKVLHYVTEILGWRGDKVLDYAPFFNPSIWDDEDDMQRVELRCHSKRALPELEASTLNLQYVVDPNLAIAMHSVGFAFKHYCGHEYANHAWWETRIGYKLATGTVEIPHSMSWAKCQQLATHKVQAICHRRWMWDVFYSYDNTYSINENFLKNISSDLSEEDQVLAIVKHGLFKPWIRLGYVKKFKLSYKPNKANPGIRQMHIHIIAQHDWFRLCFTFSPMLIELFNWNPIYLENGVTITIDHDHNDFLIDMSSYAPPEIDALRNDSLQRARRSLYDVVHSAYDSKQIALQVAKPYLSPTEPRLLEFSYQAETPEGQPIPPAEGPCPKASSLYCSEGQLKYILEGQGKYAYSLRSCKWRMNAQLLKQNGLSLTKENEVYPIKNAQYRLIERLKLKLGDFTIVDTTGFYYVMEQMLSLLYKPKSEVASIDRNAFLESKNFAMSMDLFRYDEAPPFYIIPENELSVEITLNQPIYYTESAAGYTTQQHYIRMGKNEIVVDKAPLTNHIKDSMDYAWRRHAPYYTYMRREMEFAYVRSGSMIFREVLFRKNPKAKHYILGLAPATNQNKPLRFENCGLKSITLKQGDAEIGSYLLNYQANPHYAIFPYAKFKQTRSKDLPELSMADYMDGKFLFVFKNQDMESTEPIKVEIVFTKTLSEALSLFCMSETEETITLGTGGRLMKTTRDMPQNILQSVANITVFGAVNDPDADNSDHAVVSLSGTPLIAPEPDYMADEDIFVAPPKPLAPHLRKKALDQLAKLKGKLPDIPIESLLKYYPFVKYNLEEIAKTVVHLMKSEQTNENQATE